MSAGFLVARVVGAAMLAPDIRLLELAATEGRPLPPHEPGAHVDVLVQLSGGAQIRSYSLLGDGSDAGRYAIAVRLDPSGGGGSRFMHALAVGDALSVSAPRCHFPIAPGASEHRLIAGGIGITATLSLLRALVQGRAPVTLDYAAHTADRLVFRDAIAALLPQGAARFHVSAEGGRLDLDAALSGYRPGAMAYVCGPRRMVAAAQAAASRTGWPEGALRIELFGTHAPEADRPFRVTLLRSGRDVEVPAGRSLLDVLEEAGTDPIADCRRGECGLCVVHVAGVEGRLLHRDVFLSERQRAEGCDICTCVSRAEGRVLLDA